MTTFSERLQQLRKQKKLTQSELGTKASIGASTIGMYEQGLRTPSLENLEALADFFNVDLDYLMGRSSVTAKLLTDNEVKKLETSGVSIPIYQETEAKTFDRFFKSKFKPESYVSVNPINLAGGTAFAYYGCNTYFPNVSTTGDLMITIENYDLYDGNYVLFMTLDGYITIGQISLDLQNGITGVIYHWYGKFKYENITYDYMTNLFDSNKVLGKIVEIRKLTNRLMNK